jgi:hypothetical protein
MKSTKETAKTDMGLFAKSLHYREVEWDFIGDSPIVRKHLLNIEEQIRCQDNGWLVIYPFIETPCILLAEGVYQEATFDTDNDELFWVRKQPIQTGHAISILSTPELLAAYPAQELRGLDLGKVEEAVMQGVSIAQVSVHYNVFKEIYLRAKCRYEKFKVGWFTGEGFAPQLAQGIVIDINDLAV